MGYTEDRAYWATRAGLPSDVPGLTLQQLIDLASADPADKTAANLSSFFVSHALVVGEETIPRHLVSSSSSLNSSGSVRLSYFTARKTETISQIKSLTGGTAAGATPTLCKMGVYKVEVNGDLTLVASHDNDTALWAAASTAYLKSLTASFVKVAGQRYATAALIVTGAALPTLQTSIMSSPSVIGLAAPTINSQIGSQTDLPASIAVGTLAASGTSPIYMELLP